MMIILYISITLFLSVLALRSIEEVFGAWVAEETSTRVGVFAAIFTPVILFGEAFVRVLK